MKFNKFLLKKDIILEKSAKEYLDNDFEKLIEVFFTYLINEEIELYNEKSLKYELGIFLRIILPEYNVSFEKNIKYFTYKKETVKHEIDITIYPKKEKDWNLTNNIIKKNNSQEAYAIELKFPSFKIEQTNNGFVTKYNRGTNKTSKKLEEDLIFVRELVQNGFKNAWSFVLVPEIANTIYQFPSKNRKKNSEIYNRFRENDGKIITNIYNINWLTWNGKSNQQLGKYYIKSGRE